MLRDPRYDARPFRACIGSVASTPGVRRLGGVASRFLRDPAGPQRPFERGDRRLPRVDHRLVAGRGRAQRLDPLEARSERGQEHLAVGCHRLGDRHADLAEARAVERAGRASHPVDRGSCRPPPGAIPVIGRTRTAASRRRRRTRAACSPRGRRRRSPRRAGSGSRVARRSGRPLRRPTEGRTPRRGRMSPATWSRHLPGEWSDRSLDGTFRRHARTCQTEALLGARVAVFPRSTETFDDAEHNTAMSGW